MEWKLESTSDLGPDAIARAAQAAGLWPKEPAEQITFIHEVLRDPIFVRLDATWRGLERLVQACAALDSAIRLEVFQVNRSNLVPSLTATALAPLQDAPDTPLGLLLVDHAFGPGSADMQDLAMLGSWCSALSAPLLAQADTQLLGVRHAIHLAALVDLDERLEGSRATAFAALRKESCMRWISLGIGRWLAREAHASSSLNFTEIQLPEKPETQPWAHAGWLSAIALARSHATYGHAGRAAGFAGDALHQNLPACRVPGSRPKDPESPRTSTDVTFDDALATRLLCAGLTPLVARKGSGIAAFAMLTNAYRPDGSDLSLDTSLARQMFAGRAAQHLLMQEDEVRRRGPGPSTASWLERSFEDYLQESQAMTSPRPEGASAPVQVAAEEQPTGFSIALRPDLQLEGRPVEVDLWLPIE